MAAQSDNLPVPPEITFTMSEQVDKLFEALAKAQPSFGPVKRDKTNPFYKSKYADLETVIAATKKQLGENGLTVIQLPTVKHGTVVVTTILGHSSGQWIQSVLPMPTTKPDAHGIGSAITYARRYSMQSVVGVAAEDDDDGNVAVSGSGEKPVKEARRVSESPTNGELISQAQVSRLHAIAAESGWTEPELKKLLDEFGFKSSKDVAKSVYGKVCYRLQNPDGEVA